MLLKLSEQFKKRSDYRHFDKKQSFQYGTKKRSEKIKDNNDKNGAARRR